MPVNISCINVLRMVIITVVLCHCFEMGASLSQFYTALPESHNNVNHSISQVYVNSRLTCGAMCHGRCTLFGYNENDKICYLYMQSPQNFLAGSEEEWTYYQKTKKGCDSPWLEMLGHCYLHNKKKVTWAEAKMWCESRDAYLVEIESLIESTWVALAFFLQGPCPADIFSECVAWTGGNDLVIEGHYQWNDSPLAMNYTNWLPGEPSTIYPAQGESRDCVDILKNGKWNDRPCSFLNSFICEMN